MSHIVLSTTLHLMFHINVIFYPPLTHHATVKLSNDTCIAVLLIISRPLALAHFLYAFVSVLIIFWFN